MRISLIIISFLLCASLFSCEHSLVETNDYVGSNQYVANYSSLTNQELFGQIKLERNYLVFQNEQMATEVSNRLIKMSIIERQTFESQLGYSSLTSTIENELKLPTKTQGEIKSNKYVRTDQNGIAKILFPLLRRAQILNNEGLVRIGSYIEAYSTTKYVRLKNGLLSNLTVALGKPDGDYDTYMVSTIHTSANKPSANARLLDGYGRLHDRHSQNIMGGSSPNVYYHYYDMNTDYAWYNDGLAPTGGRFIRFEFTVHIFAACRLFGPSGPFTLYNQPAPMITLPQLNGDVNVYSGSSPNTGDYSQIFAQNGYSFGNGDATISLVSGRAITDGNFHGYMHLNFNLSSSEDGNNLIIYNYDKKDF